MRDYRSHMNQATPTLDIDGIKREAKALKKAGGSMTYMQYLDQVARDRYGVRHFHEAQILARKQLSTPAPALTPAQHYLHSMQEYYLDF